MTSTRPNNWGMAKVFLLVGFIGQFVLIMLSSISFLVLERLGVKATWTQAPFYLVVPGAYLVSLIRKPQAMEDRVEFSLSFVLNAISRRSGSQFPSSGVAPDHNRLTKAGFLPSRHCIGMSEPHSDNACRLDRSMQHLITS
jgi:hypothetical protein